MEHADQVVQRKDSIMRQHKDQIDYLLKLVVQLAHEDEMELLAYLASMAVMENDPNAIEAAQRNEEQAA
jgi:hypothetical protein